MNRNSTLLFSLLLCMSLTACAQKNKEIVEFSRVEKAHELATGKDTKIAIVDWMFDLKGSQKRKYIDPVSMVPGEEAGDLKPWHGEWMAQIAHDVAPDAQIIPIRARSIETRTYEEYLIKGIYHAADQGAVAVCSSMGPLENSEALKKAVDYAEKRGTVFVDVHPEYVRTEEGKKRQARMEELDTRILHPGIVSVEAHPCKPDARRDFYTWPYESKPKYQDGWGYSIAPPVIAGTIALMKEANPDLKPEEMRSIIRTSTYDYQGFAVLDAALAVENALKTR